MNTPRYNREEMDTLFQAGVDSVAEFSVGQAEYFDQLPIATKLRESLASGESSDKIISFPTAEYTLEYGHIELPNGRYEKVHRLVNKEDPDDTLSLTPESLDAYISQLPTKTKDSSKTKLIAVFGPQVDISRKDALYQVDVGDTDLENIYLVFSGGVFEETETFVQREMPKEERTATNDLLKALERSDDFIDKEDGKAAVRGTVRAIQQRLLEAGAGKIR